MIALSNEKLIKKIKRRRMRKDEEEEEKKNNPMINLYNFFGVKMEFFRLSSNSRGTYILCQG